MTDDRLTRADISVGGIRFRLRAEKPDAAFEVGPEYAGFVIGDGGNGPSGDDVLLDVLTHPPPDMDNCEEIFDAQGNWKLLRDGDHILMPISSPALDPNLYKVLRIDEHFSRGEIYMVPEVRQVKPHSSGDGTGVKTYPFQYPLDEVLTVNLLSRSRGVELHGLGVDLDGNGVIFTGTSGAGKSTLAELWKQRAGNTVLSDDRLIVRPGPGDHTEDFLLFGTPWHGDAGVSAPGGVPLKRVLVLNQARENRLVELSAAEAATMLLIRCFPTFWDHRGMDFTVDFIGRICSSIPCYELRFLPEQAAIDTAVADL